MSLLQACAPDVCISVKFSDIDVPFSRCRNREHVREGAVRPQDPAGRPEGDAGGDALPVRLPQPVSVPLQLTIIASCSCCSPPATWFRSCSSSGGVSSEHLKHVEMTESGTCAVLVWCLLADI